MQTKKFHLGDVLSIITGRLVSPRHINGIHDLLNFMTSDNLFTHQLLRASNKCKPYLIKQFPQLTGAEMDSAFAELDNALKSKSGKMGANKIVANWLSKQVAKYGKMFEINPIPTDVHEVKDPITEIAKMMGKPKVIVVKID